jgi:sec-independent protein translocase protein TatC
MRNGPIRDDDYFAETRMTFGEHLEDLRVHMWRAIYGFLVAMVVSFIPGWTVLRFIAAPVEQEIQRFYDERVERAAKKLAEDDAEMKKLDRPREEKLEVNVYELAKVLGVSAPADSTEESWVTITTRVHPLSRAIILNKAQQLIGRRPGLSTLGPLEAFMAYIKVCAMCGLVLASPWIFYQLWSFVAAGLYPHEKRLVNYYLPVSIVLFLIGAVLCQFFVLPKALEALLWFNYWLDLEPDLRFNEWLGFAILLPVLFGVSFQLPMVMVFLDRIGIANLATYQKHWRIAVFLIFGFAAVITPVDAFSMLSLAITMCVLYGMGMLLCWFNARRRPPETGDGEANAMVEV